MPATWKTVRVFISSTFRDMQSERDWLVRFVFPKLRQELLQRHIHLVDVDLRWGVTSEQDALSVCREVVDECRPRFLCMLGGRYGWVPPGKTRSITADEVHYRAAHPQDMVVCHLVGASRRPRRSSKILRQVARSCRVPARARCIGLTTWREEQIAIGRLLSRH